MPFDENDNSDKKNKKRLLGYNFETDITIPVSDQVAEMLRAAVFPLKYKIPTDCITPVKNQYIGNCWAYTATAMLESYLLINELTPKDNHLDNTFSETHMTYSVFDTGDKNDPTTVNDGGLTPIPPISASTTYDYGANRVETSSYMSKRQNTVLEVIDKNFLTEKVNRLPKRANSISLLKAKQFVVKGIYLIEDPVIPNDPSFINRIKYSVMTYGVVGLAFEHSDIYELKIKFRGSNTTSYYRHSADDNDDAKDIGGHTVAVVGWNDNFPINNFKEQPQKPGAFKAKNSWGTKNDNGYIWISYENIGTDSAYCITEMTDDINDEPTGVYTHCKFGMNTYYPKSLGEKQVTFEDKFTVTEDKEIITGIGLYNITPCYATVKLIIGKKTIVLIDKAYLPHPGYRILDTKEISLDAIETKFKIKVVYDKINLTGVFVPLEYKYKEGCDNLDLDTVSGYIKVGEDGHKTSIKDINKNNKKKFGNLALYVITKGTGKEATNNYLAYKALTMPAPNNEGRIDNLPATIKLADVKADVDVAVEWRVEPYNFVSYNPSYKSPFEIYNVTNASGIINNSDKAEKVYITAVIGTTKDSTKDLPKYLMKKSFQAEVPPKTNKNYIFNVSEVTNANVVNLSGVFLVYHANVIITCNNVERQTKTDANGNWTFLSFPLYDVTVESGWNDGYVNSIITVEIKDDNKILLAIGKRTVTLEKPFDVIIDKNGNVVEVIVLVACSAALIAALVYACSLGTPVLVAVGGKITLDAGMSAILLALETALITITGSETGAVITTTGTMFNKVKSVKNIDIVYRTTMRTNLSGNNLTTTEKNAAIAMEITKGGSVENCNVTLDIVGDYDIGGIFYEGEDVTVSNCSVTAEITDTGSCGLIAHTMTGKSIIENCSVNGKISSDSIGGMVVNSSGSIKNSEVYIEASAQNAVSAVCLNSAGTEISEILIQGSYSASANNAKASGIVNNMKGGSISDCRISANINTSSESDDNCAAGIACLMSGDASIKNCITAGSLNSGKTGSALGIATGISGTPSSISNCVSVYPVIHGKNVRRISTHNSSGCIAYDGTQSDSGVSLISSGEQLKSATEILAQKTFSSLNFDFTNKWLFVPKKDFPILKKFAQTLYDYPFPNPYPTQSGEYKIPSGTSLVLLGAMTTSASNLSWRNLSPAKGGLKSGEPTFEVLKDLDEFFMDLGLSFSVVGKYTLEVTSVVDSVTFSMPIVIEVV